MHTTDHIDPETADEFHLHYNPDLSGNVLIDLPDRCVVDIATDRAMVRIPAAALLDLICDHIKARRIDILERADTETMLRWLTE